MENTTNQVQGDLTPQQALNVLVQAVKIAQSKGAYTLEDSEVIAKAVRVFATPEKAADAPAETEASADTAEKPTASKKLKKA